MNKLKYVTMKLALFLPRFSDHQAVFHIHPPFSLAVYPLFQPGCAALPPGKGDQRESEYKYNDLSVIV